MDLKQIELWHKRARPAPDARALDVQLGCHIEEIVEMFDELTFENDSGMRLHASHCDFYVGLKRLSEELKKGILSAKIIDRTAFFDALCDQIVTSVGTGHCAALPMAEGVEEVNRSNWSKYDESGQPIFNEHGKIVKGPNYRAPDLGHL